MAMAWQAGKRPVGRQLRLITRQLVDAADWKIKVAPAGGKIRNENRGAIATPACRQRAPRIAAATEAKTKMLKICTLNDFLLIMLHQRRATRYLAEH
jgi:hypothetical protein